MKIKFFYAYFLCGLFFFSRCGHAYQIATINENSIEISDSLESSANGNLLIEPYKEFIGDSMTSVLCQSKKAIFKARPESELGNLVADLCLEIGRELYTGQHKNIDLCMMNTGGLRSSLPQGNITVGDVFQLMPFENELVVVELDAQAMRSLFAYLKASGGEPISGLRIALYPDGYDVKINGKNFDEQRTYAVLTSDYLANGGDNMDFFTQEKRLSLSYLGIKLRDAIMLHFKRKGEIKQSLNPKIDGRLQIEE